MSVLDWIALGCHKPSMPSLAVRASGLKSKLTHYLLLLAMLVAGKSTVPTADTASPGPHHPVVGTDASEARSTPAQ